MRNKSYNSTILKLSAIALSIFMAGPALAGNSAGDVNEKTGYRKIKPPEAWGTTIMERNTKGTDTKSVLFPHWAHRDKYTCSVCHTEIGFSINAGGTDIKQADIEAGKYCGECHDTLTAFGPMECVRCHSRGIDVPENGNIGKVTGNLPPNPFGNQVDWVKAQREGAIKPVSPLDGAKKMTVLDLDITIPVTKYTPHPPDVIFPHKAHTEQMECATCHPSIFVQKTGGNPDMNMMKIISGKYCGECHTTVAFPIEDCFRCHSGPIPVAVESEEPAPANDTDQGKKPAAETDTKKK